MIVYCTFVSCAHQGKLWPIKPESHRDWLTAQIVNILSQKRKKQHQSIPTYHCNSPFGLNTGNSQRTTHGLLIPSDGLKCPPRPRFIEGFSGFAFFVHFIHSWIGKQRSYDPFQRSIIVTIGSCEGAKSLKVPKIPFL